MTLDEQTPLFGLEPFDDDVALCGPDTPRAKNIEELIRYCLTVRKRFGNTCVNFGIKWGSSGLWARDDFQKKAEQDAETIKTLKARWVKLHDWASGSGQDTRAKVMLETIELVLPIEADFHTCRTCEGTGKYEAGPDADCRQCDGTGRIPKEE